MLVPGPLRPSVPARDASNSDNAGRPTTANVLLLGFWIFGYSLNSPQAEPRRERWRATLKF